MYASLNNYRQSPRKVRLVASMLRGKSVAEARRILRTAVKFASLPLLKLLESGVANAKHNAKVGPESLFVKSILVDGGAVMKRSMPRAHGSAYQILKRTSHISLVLGERNSEKSKVKSVK